VLAELELAARDARDIEQVVEQPRHVDCLAADHRVALLDDRRSNFDSSIKLVALRTRGERIAQLVR
jgi:hypothetical protein